MEVHEHSEHQISSKASGRLAGSEVDIHLPAGRNMLYLPLPMAGEQPLEAPPGRARRREDAGGGAPGTGQQEEG
jgi:hypothetical protein